MPGMSTSNCEFGPPSRQVLFPVSGSVSTENILQSTSLRSKKYLASGEWIDGLKNSHALNYLAHKRSQVSPTPPGTSSTSDDG